MRLQKARIKFHFNETLNNLSSRAVQKFEKYFPPLDFFPVVLNEICPQNWKCFSTRRGENNKFQNLRHKYFFADFGMLSARPVPVF